MIAIFRLSNIIVEYIIFEMTEPKAHPTMINGRQIMTMCIYISVGRDVRKNLLCDFCAKIDFFAEIDCLGVKQLENHGVHFFSSP